MGTSKPSPELKILAVFILKVYVPTWFEIKFGKSVFEGPKILLSVILKTRYLKKDVREVVDAVISNNGYFAHPENVLLSMIVDKDPMIRKSALQKILNVRSSVPSASVRKFKIPNINFKARNYTELVDWKKCEISEPPILKNFSEVELKNIAEGNFELIKKFRDIPCHTQAVERCVKLVTEASSKVCGAKNRDGIIKSTLISRSMVPVFNTKKDYKVE